MFFKPTPRWLPQDRPQTPVGYRHRRGCDMHDGVDLDEAYIDSVAPNRATMQRGRELLAKGALSGLRQSPDGAVLFASCGSSGRRSYNTRVDFSVPGAPTWRCSCSSRQRPCKHGLGLMYAYAQGQRFTEAEPPKALKRTQTKATKKKTTKRKLTKRRRAATERKIKAQLAGLELLRGLVEGALQAGLASFGPEAAQQLSAQADRLGAKHHLPGARLGLRRFIGCFFTDNNLERGELDAGRRARMVTPAIAQLSALYALTDQGPAVLNARLTHPELSPDPTTPVTPWLEQVWELAALAEAGLTEAGVELMQLAFWSWADGARQSEVDLGVWLDLGSGAVHYTEQLRPPYSHLRPHDTEFSVLQIPTLYLLPGQLNHQVRWEQATPREPTEVDFARAASKAQPVAPALRAARDQLKAPLADPHPYALISFAMLGRVGEVLVMQDAAGDRLRLVEDAHSPLPEVLPLLDRVPPQFTRDGALLGRWVQDLDAQTLGVVPLALLKPSEDPIRLV